MALKASSDVTDSALIIGQEPDLMRGGFVSGQSYLGDLSEFNIWISSLFIFCIGRVSIFRLDAV